MNWRWLFIPIALVNGCCRIPRKISALFDLTRFSRNFLPTTFVIAASVQPPINVGGLVASSAMVSLLTSTSMVVNDIWDIDADLINHPTRPLARGDISKKEAAGFAAILSALYIYLGVNFIPKAAAPIWILSFVIIHAYTPILKRIFLIKNLSCAIVVAATVPFVALSSGSALSPYFTHVVFIGSMYKELLMDIMDRRGDELSGINTIPVLCGNRSTVGAIYRIMFASILYFTFINRNYVYIVLGYLPLYYRLLEVQNNHYQSLHIKRALKTTTYVLGVIGLLSILQHFL